MVQLIEVGSQDLFNSNGVIPDRLIWRGNIPVILAPDFVLHAIEQPKLEPTNAQTGVANGATFSLIPALAGCFINLYFLTLESSVAGSVQVLDNGVVVFDFTLVVNVPRPFELPSEGIITPAVNTAITIKNNTGSSANIKVNFAYSYVGPH